MTSKIKVNILADGGDNSIITSDGAGSFTASSSLASSVQSVGGIQNTPAFSVKLSGNQSIANATWTKVTLDTEDYDTDNTFASNKFTVPSGKAGKYCFHYNIGSAAALDDTERLVGAIYKNGSKVSEYSTNSNNSPGNNIDNYVNNTITLDLSAGDYIELYVYHTEGAAMNVLSNSCLLQGHKLIGA
jgi:hypothetical protein